MVQETYFDTSKVESPNAEYDAADIASATLGEILGMGTGSPISGFGGGLEMDGSGNLQVNSAYFDGSITGISNPLTANLDAANYDVTNVGALEANEVSHVYDNRTVINSFPASFDFSNFSRHKLYWIEKGGGTLTLKFDTADNHYWTKRSDATLSTDNGVEFELAIATSGSDANGSWEIGYQDIDRIGVWGSGSPDRPNNQGGSILVDGTATNSDGTATLNGSGELVIHSFDA